MQIEPKIAGDETEPKRAGDEFLTIPGLLATLNKREKVATREFLYRAVQRGDIPSYKIGERKIFVRLSEVLDALRQK